MAITMVNLSNTTENKLRTEGSRTSTTYYSDDYQGLSVIGRAKKAAMLASDNGRCWWIHDYIYRELVWRNPK
tara:strand:+ start:444 stop:659 length:216 start_codon:yes stop_codon:yes gene_type:complete